MSDTSTEEEAPAPYIYVTGGPNLRDGQIALAEVHPDHPYQESQADHKEGENQAYIVKGDKSVGEGWVARTREVQTKLARGFLREKAAPKNAPIPSQKKPTESSQRAQELLSNKELVGTVPAGTSAEDQATAEAAAEAASTPPPSDASAKPVPKKSTG